MGQTADIIPILEEEVRLAPDCASLHHTLADARHAQGLLEPAIESYLEALNREPGLVEAWWGLGCAQGTLGDHAGAAESLRRLQDLRPEFGQGWHNLGKSLYELGQIDQAIDAFQKAFACLSPEERTVPLTNLAMVIPGSPAVSNQDILDCRRAWASHCLPGEQTPRGFADRRNPSGRPLRVGYVSAYFAR